MLGLSGPDETRAIKRAYAQRLKAIDRSDPVAFQALRDAYDAALRQASTSEGQEPQLRPSIRQLVRGEHPDVEDAESPPGGMDVTHEPSPLPRLEPLQECPVDAAIQVKLEKPEEANTSRPAVAVPLSLPADISVEDSSSAELLADVRVALESENVTGLRRIMQQIQPGDFALRRQVEQIAYETLVLRVEKAAKIPIALIIWIDEEFFWLSDTSLAACHFKSPQHFRSLAVRLARRRDHRSLAGRLFFQARNADAEASIIDRLQKVSLNGLILIVTTGALLNVITDWQGFGRAVVTVIAWYVLAFVAVVVTSLSYYLLWVMSFPFRWLLRPLFRYLTTRISPARREHSTSRWGLYEQGPMGICITIGFLQTLFLFVALCLIVWATR